MHIERADVAGDSVVFHVQKPTRPEDLETIPPFEGWLLKKNSKGIRGIRLWRRRYFALNSTGLSWFADASKCSSRVRSGISIDNISAATASEKEANRFDIHTSTFIDRVSGMYTEAPGKVYSLRCTEKDAALKQRWLELISRHMQRSKEVQRAKSTAVARLYDPGIEDDGELRAQIFKNLGLAQVGHEAFVRHMVKKKLPTALDYVLTREPSHAKAFWQETIDCRGMVHYAAVHSDARCVEVLVKHGAPINQATSKYETGISEEGGWTPLDLAIWFKKKDVEMYLTGLGAERGTGAKGVAWQGGF
jgi:hypothetical protein